MAKILFADKASTTMSGSLASGLGTLNVTPGGGARFPAPTGGDFFYATLYQKDGGGAEINIEVVKITAKPSADSFTISQRDVTNITGYGGGYAYPGAAGTVYVELRWLEKAATAMMQAADLTAANITNTPAGSIAATTVQAALNELDTEKAPLASPALTGTPTAPTAGAGTSTTQIATTAFVTSGLATHTSATTAHGVTGNIAGTGSANTFTALQTVRTPSGIRSEAAATQDAVVLAGRAGGTGSYAVVLTPATLTATRTLTLPDATTTMVGTDVAQTLTNKTLVAASNTITTAASGNLTSTNLNAALAELQSDIDTRAALTGATFTSTVQVTKNRADAMWNTAHFIAYTPTAATTDFASIAYHVQDVSNAPQWGFNSGDGSRFGLYDSNGSTRLLTFPVGGLGSGVPKLTSNDLSIDAMLTALSGVTTAANKLIYATGSNTFTTTDLTAAGRALLDDADAATQRTTLGLGTAATATLGTGAGQVPTADQVPGLVSGSVPVRQTVLSGPVDSNGMSAFGGATGSTTVTASGTLKATAAAGGDVNYTGSITNPSWTGLSTNGTMYLYLSVTSGGVVTTGSTTLAPVYQWGGTYSTTNNQNTFNIQEMTMKVGNGSTASQVYRVFVGEVTVAGGVVTAITWYALMGRALLGQASLSTSTAYALTHNIGHALLKANCWLECTSADNGYAIGDRLFVDAATRSGDTPTAGGQMSLNSKSANLSIGAALGASLAKSSPAYGVLLTIGSWKWGAYVERAW